MALGRFASGVVAVTGKSGGQPCGLTIQSFASVSLEPPMILICPARKSTSWPAIAESGTFCVNVLQANQQSVCNSLAKSGGNKFGDITWMPSSNHSNPIVSGAAVWFDCTIHSVSDGGDHHVVLGRVVESGSDAEDPEPLIFHASQFTTLIQDRVTDLIPN
jgi:3-hydroxy-9,10-secoandrosta-1,3,5(10)-triene-9,17-dione monooxygenase reductase component